MIKIKKENNNYNLEQNKDDQSALKDTKKAKHKFWKIFLTFFILLFTTMSLIRVPYVGAFFDTTFFNIIFGYTKYFAYLLIYLFFILWFFPDKLKKLFSKTNILTMVIFWVMINIIVTSIALTILKINGTFSQTEFRLYWITTNGSTDGYFTNWAVNDWKNLGNYNYFFNARSYGGIVAYLIVVLFQTFATPLLAIIISIVLVLFIIFFVKKKVLIKSKEAKVTKKENLNKEVKNLNEQVNVEQKAFVKKEQQIDNDKKENYKNINYINMFLEKINKKITAKNNFRFLDEPTNDFNDELKNNSKKLQEKVTTLFLSLKIDANFISETIMFKSVILKFKIKGKKAVDFIDNNPDKINDFFSNQKINWYTNEDDEFVISEKYDLNPTVSLYEIIHEIGDNKHFVFGLGKDDKRKILSFNALQNPNTILFGSKGSGNSMLLCNMALSFASLNPASIVDISIIDPTDKTFKYLSLLPQLSKYSYSVLENNNLLTEFTNTTKARLSVLKENNCVDIYEYKNKYVDDDNTKINLLVINCLEEIINDENNLNNLMFILQNAKKVGIITLMSMNNVTDNILKIKNLFDNVIVLKVDTVQDSNSILNSPTGFYLWGSGEGILKINNSTHHFQTAFITKDKIENLIKAISN